MSPSLGEMVTLLWADGKSQAAIRLEQLWNQLAKTHSFQLHCAYPLNLFSGERDGEPIQEICAEHSHVVPTAERYTTVPTDEERLRTILYLQQKAEALETEVRERRKIQRALQQRRLNWVTSLENAVIGMRWLARRRHDLVGKQSGTGFVRLRAGTNTSAVTFPNFSWTLQWSQISFNV